MDCPSSKWGDVIDHRKLNQLLDRAVDGVPFHVQSIGKVLCLKHDTFVAERAYELFEAFEHMALRA